MPNHNIDNMFDPIWYLDTYPDVFLMDMAPIDHYDWIGKSLGRTPNGRAVAYQSPHMDGQFSNHKNKIPFQGFGIIRHNPLVSISIVSYNSGSDLRCLASSLFKQTYRNFEIFLIENGCEDTSKIFEQIEINTQFKIANNVGFAQANNLAMTMSSGELILLLNPDTRIECDTLQSLVDSLRFDQDAAVAVPKINFFEKFVRLKIEVNAQFSISRSELVEGLSYRKIFIRQGAGNDDDLKSDINGVFEVDLAYEQPREILLNVRSDTELRLCSTQIGHGQPQRSSFFGHSEHRPISRF